MGLPGRVGLKGGRQGESEGAAPAGAITGCRQLTAHAPHQVAGDGQANAAATALARPRRVHPVKALKDVGQRPGRKSPR